MFCTDRKELERLLMILEQKNYLFAYCRFRKDKEELYLLGEGSSSVVYEMVDQFDEKKHYALKVSGLGNYSIADGCFYEITEDYRRLGIASEHVVHMMDAKQCLITGADYNEVSVQDVTGADVDKEGIILQFILMEKLQAIVRRERQKVFLQREKLREETEVCRFALQIGKGLCAIHGRNYIHRDVKLENAFWDAENNCYKIGDFATAERMDKRNGNLVCTDGYAPPEIQKRQVTYHEEMADIYSLGVCLFLLLNHLTFPESSGYWINKVQYRENFIFPKPKNASVQMADIIRKMCSYEKENRYQSMEEVVDEMERLLQEYECG